MVVDLKLSIFLGEYLKDNNYNDIQFLRNHLEATWSHLEAAGGCPGTGIWFGEKIIMMYV